MATIDQLQQHLTEQRVRDLHRVALMESIARQGAEKVEQLRKLVEQQLPEDKDEQ